MSPVRVTSVYLPTVDACAKALGADAGGDPHDRFEVPREHYDALIDTPNAGLAPTVACPGPTAVPRDRIAQGTLTYAQALTLARGGRLRGVAVAPETGRVVCDCAFGLGFAAGYARARWAGADDDRAIAQALAWQLQTANTAGGHIAERLHGASVETSVLARAAAGIAQSPAGRSTVDAAVGVARSLAGGVRGSIAAAPMRANPVFSTLTAVVNLDLYRAALARSISWQQFAKNLAIKSSGAVTAAGGWMTGATVGAAMAGPFGALIGGLLGAAGGGSAGSAAAKRVADRIVPDDAQRLLEIVRGASEAVACEYLLVDAELDLLAARLGERFSPAWLRRLYHAGWAPADETWREERVRAFAEDELRRLCEDIAAERMPVEPPSPIRVAAMLRRVGGVAAAGEGAAGGARDIDPGPG